MKMIDSPQGEITMFVALATLPVVGLGITAAMLGGLAAFPAATPLAMFAPAIAAIIMMKAKGRPLRGPNGLGLGLGRLRWWFGALFGIAALCGASFAMTAIIDLQAVSSAAEFEAAIGRLKGVPDLGAWQSRAIAALVLTILIAPFLNLPLFLGEELGWRSYLTPRLVKLFGRRGVLIAGAIWALWHLPLILLGHNYGSEPLLGLVIWIPLCMALSVLFTALRNLGGSVWPAAIAHGVLNQLATLLTGIILVGARFDPLLHGAAGLAGLLVFGCAATVVYIRKGALLDVVPALERIDTGRSETDELSLPVGLGNKQ